MAKVKVTNICKDKQVAPSFKTLKPNMSTVIDDSIITPGDKRLERRGLIKIEAYAPEDDENPKKVEPRNIPNPETKPEVTEEKNKIITGSDFDGKEKKAKEEEVVTPDALNEEKEAPAEDEPEEETKDESEDEPEDVQQESKVYTEEELSNMTRDELRAIG